MRGRPECLEHALQCFARLVRLLLGPTALADRKMASGHDLLVRVVASLSAWAVFGAGPTLCVLGISVVFDKVGYMCRPDDVKVRKWIRCVKDALDTGVLRPGEASKLAGRLQWACQHMFNRLGRAMLRAIYDQQRCRLLPLLCSREKCVALRC